MSAQMTLIGEELPAVGDELARARALLRARPDLARAFLRVAEPAPVADAITEPRMAMAALRPLLAGRETEALACLALDTAGRLVDSAILATGSDRFTVVCPRQIFRWALTRERPVASVVLGHNHPSGDPTPSPQDREVTTRVASAGRAIGIRLADHIVYADPGKFTSLAELGVLPAFSESATWTA